MHEDISPVDKFYIWLEEDRIRLEEEAKLPKKKKRGRKPKDNTIINDNPIFADDKDGIDDLIIKLNYDNTDNEIICTVNEIENYSTQISKNNTSEICWNCCHEIDDIIGLPIKYHDKRFYTVGDFCSLECACRYAYENYNNIHEILSITNLYNNIVLNKTDKINMAPNKLVIDNISLLLIPVSIASSMMLFMLLFLN